MLDRSCEQAEGPVRLAFGPFLWWSFAALAVTGEVALWTAIQQQAGGFPASLRLAWLIGYTPKTLFLAFVLASVLTTIVDLLVRAVADAPLRRWLSPRSEREDDAGRGFGFHFGATERVITEVPGRQISGRRSQAGTLVLTDRRVWFFPSTWDAEPWSVPRDAIQATLLDQPSGIISRFLRGLPDHLLLISGPESGTTARFALAEPQAVRCWFDA